MIHRRSDAGAILNEIDDFNAKLSEILPEGS